MTGNMNEPMKPTAAHAFGWDELHPGGCCDCCNGYCVKPDWTPQPDGPLLRFEWAGREWISDRYISLDAAELVDIPADTVAPVVPVAGMASRVKGAATGLIGDKTLAVLDRLHVLGVADSDVPNQHALVVGGRMVGFAMKGRDGLPVEYLDRARRMARHMGSAIGEPSLVAAALAVVAWLATSGVDRG